MKISVKNAVTACAILLYVAATVEVAQGGEREGGGMPPWNPPIELTCNGYVSAVPDAPVLRILVDNLSSPNTVQRHIQITSPDYNVNYLNGSAIVAVTMHTLGVFPSTGVKLRYRGRNSAQEFDFIDLSLPIKDLGEGKIYTGYGNVIIRSLNLINQRITLKCVSNASRSLVKESDTDIFELLEEINAGR